MSKLFVFLLVPTMLFASIPTRTPLPQKELVSTIQKNHKGGTWYMADDGHAVYCYGPQRMIPDPTGGLMKIATFCRGDRAIVKLKE
jgi:hypothetical protein